jgi:hypothetical protein
MEWRALSLGVSRGDLSGKRAVRKTWKPGAAAALGALGAASQAIFHAAGREEPRLGLSKLGTRQEKPLA